MTIHRHLGMCNPDLPRTRDDRGSGSDGDQALIGLRRRARMSHQKTNGTRPRYVRHRWFG